MENESIEKRDRGNPHRVPNSSTIRFNPAGLPFQLSPTLPFMRDDNAEYKNSKLTSTPHRAEDSIQGTIGLFYIYRASVRALFILAILEETLRSMVRSPISTTRPPTMSGLTLVTTLSFLPWLNSDLATAFSRREMVLASSSCTRWSAFPFKEEVKKRFELQSRLDQRT